jgi:hypothetical protein
MLLIVMTSGLFLPIVQQRMSQQFGVFVGEITQIERHGLLRWLVPGNRAVSDGELVSPLTSSPGGLSETDGAIRLLDRQRDALELDGDVLHQMLKGESVIAIDID